MLQVIPIRLIRPSKIVPCRRQAPRRSCFPRGSTSMLAQRRPSRSEEHTSELQSPCNLVCRLLLEKKKLEEAQTHFEAALRIDPNNAEVHSGYAYLLER